MPPISTIGFGLTTVSSERRLPSPPAKMTTFILRPQQSPRDPNPLARARPTSLEGTSHGSQDQTATWSFARARECLDLNEAVRFIQKQAFPRFVARLEGAHGQGELPAPQGRAS